MPLAGDDMTWDPGQMLGEKGTSVTALITVSVPFVSRLRTDTVSFTGATLVLPLARENTTNRANSKDLPKAGD
jgi:hypothetical protein